MFIVLMLSSGLFWTLTYLLIIPHRPVQRTVDIV